MSSGTPRLRLGFVLLALLSLAAFTPACGGGGDSGGQGPDGAGQGLELINFLQAGQDNVPINRILEFRFSEPVAADTINSGSIQIREGPSFGLTVEGTFQTEGAVVSFLPTLPTLCDKSDSGFKPGTTYRVTLMGFPEEFTIRNTKSQPLTETETFEFGTRPESDPEFLEDQVPGVQPTVISLSPTPGEAAVTVIEGNEIVVEFSENVDPCSVNSSSVTVFMYETGDPDMGAGEVIPGGEPNAGNVSGFVPWADSRPDDPYSWGGNAILVDPPQAVPVELNLEQDFDSTQLRIVPSFGRFPENAMLVVDLSFEIVDYGQQPLSPVTFSFTTQNLPQQSATKTIEFDRSVESWPVQKRTADIDTGRSPSLAQGWMLFAGDGDNGSSMSTPSFPIFSPYSCDSQPNDGVLDYFDPSTNVSLHTGSSLVPETCSNPTDGSQAVIYEFATFRIRSGVTVTVTGVNPLIILVQGEVLIESGGILRAIGGTGGNGATYSNGGGGLGGTGVAGGGKGGAGKKATGTGTGWTNGTYGDDGVPGVGSEDYGVVGGLGAGHGNISSGSTAFAAGTSSSPSGGGGGHATDGAAGTANMSAATLDGTADGAGGETYPADSMLYTPSAGSGGGGSSYMRYPSYAYVYTYYNAPGAGGGAGGGFIDITSQADIRIYGRLDVSGGRGGNGGYGGYWSAGGGGGGSGGGVRLLTPGDIDVTNGAISTAGGSGGIALNSQYTQPNPSNVGGVGGSGRLVLEDGDTLVTGIGTADLTPTLGMPGFFLGPFQATRFLSGGRISEAASDPIQVGPLSGPTFEEPTASDFSCEIPAEVAMGATGTSIIIEGRGLGMLPDGSPDLTAPEAWYTIGYFANSGTPSLPAWNPSSNPPDALPGDNNVGVGISNLDGNQFIEVRVRFFLPDTIGATDPGPWMDWMVLRFTYDQ